MSTDIKPVAYRLAAIKTEQFAIIKEVFKEGEQVQFKYKINYGYELEKRIVATTIHIAFEQNGLPFLKLEVACLFDIEQNSWNNALNADSGKYQFDKPFFSHLAALTVGTARGILHSKTENSTFNQIVIPPINVSDLITDESIILNP